MSAREVSLRMGMSAQYVAQLESGRIVLTVEKLLDILKICDFPVEQKGTHNSFYQKIELADVIEALVKRGGYILFTHGNRNGETIGEMLGENFYYGALDSSRVRELLAENGFEILTFMGNYSEPTTGTRDLLVTARKTK